MTEITRCRTITVLTTALVSLLGGRALAQQTPPPLPAGALTGGFGERGQVAISGDMKFNIQHESYSAGGRSFTTYEFQPALDYFVSPNVSVGGLISIRKEADSADYSLSVFGIGARAGYNVGLSNAVSLWIRGGLRYEHITAKLSGSPDDSGYAVPLTIQAHLLWHPATHFFLGIGPYLDTDLLSKRGSESAPKTTDIGISSTVGGYFSGL